MSDRPTTVPTAAPAAADRVIEQEYEVLRTSVCGALGRKLAARGLRLDPADLDALYNQAWHALWSRLRAGEQVDNHAGFLVQAAFFRAIDDVRRDRPDRRSDADLAEVGVEPDVDQLLDDRDRLRAFTQALKDGLTRRESQTAVLCYLHGLTRPEAATALGLNPKRIDKLMDAASRKLGVLTDHIAHGSWCDTRSSLVSAYALGVLDPDGDRHALAVEHLDSCPGCRRHVLTLRGLAAIAPPPVAVLAAAAGAGSSGSVRARRSRSHGPTALAVAAVAAVAIAIAAAVLRSDDPQRPAAAQPATATSTDQPSATARSSQRTPGRASTRTRRQTAKRRSRRAAVAASSQAASPVQATASPASTSPDAASGEATPPAVSTNAMTATSAAPVPADQVSASQSEDLSSDRRSAEDTPSSDGEEEFGLEP